MASRNRNKTKVNYKKGLWSPDEDQRLRDYIIKNGLSCWSLVSVRAGLQRNGKSCRLRWINYLRPGLKRGVFSREEEETVIKLQAKLGNKWSQIAMHLPGRTDNEVKNHWNSYLKKEVMKDKDVSDFSAEDAERSITFKEANNHTIINAECSKALESCVMDSVQSTTTSTESDLNDQAVPKQLPKVLFTDWLTSSYANAHSSSNFDDEMRQPWNCSNTDLKKVNWTESTTGNYAPTSNDIFSSGLYDITSSRGVTPEQFAPVGHIPEELLNLLSAGQFCHSLSMNSDFSSYL